MPTASMSTLDAAAQARDMKNKEMFQKFAAGAARVTGPVLIHWAAANMVMLLFGLYLEDAAFLTGLTAALVLPLFLKMYRADTLRMEKPCGECGRLHLWDGFFIAALGVACNLGLSMLLALLQRVLPLSNAQQESLLAGNLAAQFLGVGILAPAMEEVLFRGLVYRRLKGYTGGVWLPAAASAAIFALYHGNMRQMLFAFPMGLLLAGLYQRYGTLKAPFICHAAVNLSTILL